MNKAIDIDKIHGLGFSDEEISACVKNKGLLSIELEFTKKCNLRCLYCYSSAGDARSDELNFSELKDVITQAKEMGAKKIILLGGGEPLLYPRLTEIVEYIASLGMRQILFTNGTLITQESAELFYKNNVFVVIKCNSFDPAVQDLLAGVDGMFKSIRKGLNNLMDAGYPSDGSMLGIQTVVCRQNINELSEMWTWARENKIIPYFEILTHQGRANEHPELDVPIADIQNVFEELKQIDSQQFGIEWKSRPTIAGFSCKRHLYSCLINSQGDVQPCTGIDMAVGSIRKKQLKEILYSSPVISDLRNIYEKIEGECRSCDHNMNCYGCRGNAYQITGNYLATDPTCWYLQKRNK